MNDAQRCRNLIALADSGYSLRVFLRVNGRRYFLMLVLFIPVILLAAANTVSLRPLWTGLIGALAGALLRDAGWLLRIKESWPLTIRITNWELVREIAASQAPPTRP